MRLCVPSLLFVLLIAPAGVSMPDEGDVAVTTRIPFQDPVPDLRDAYGLYDGREKVGFGRQTLERTDDGEAIRYVSRSRFLADVVTLGERGRLDFESTDTFDGRPPFALLAAREASFDGVANQRVEVVGTGPSTPYTCAVVREGVPQPARSLSFDYSLIDRLTHVEWVRSQPEVGASIRVREFNITDLEEDVYTYTCLERGWVIPSAIRVEAFRLAMHSRRRGDLGEAWMDVEGRLLTMRIASRLVVRIESEAQARRKDCASGLFAFGRVPVAEKLGEARDVKRLEFEAFGRDARDWLAEAVVGMPRTTLLSRSERGDPRVRIDGGGEGQPDVPGHDANDPLAATATYPTADADVRRIVEAIDGDHATPRERVERLLTYVARYLGDVHAPHEPTVDELLRVEALGDETEHARLFVTLARAAGVPAREVHGLVYLGDEVQAFGPHRWCEVLLAGRWEEVDPTWEQLRVDATHIPLLRGDVDATDIYRRTQGMAFELREVVR